MFRLSLLLAGSIFLTPVLAAPPDVPVLPPAYFDCFTISRDIERLKCYDRLAGSEGPAALAQVPEDRRDSIRDRQRRMAELESRDRAEQRGALVADDPNYFVYAIPVDDKLGDEQHAEFYLSIKYTLGELALERWQERLETRDRIWSDGLSELVPDRLNLHYNGLYDFYLIDSDRYTSAPVISRRQNPGITFEWDYSSGRNTVRAGWFHESNGQQLEQGQAADFFESRDLFGEDYALAKVSRGWDYLLLRWERSESNYSELLPVGPEEDDKWLRYNVEYRGFCNCQAFGFVDGREDRIWWEPGNGADIGDYDGLRGMIETGWHSEESQFSMDARLELKTNTGGSFAQHWGGKLTLGANFRNLRGTLFYFDGYGREPSTYHLRTRYMGLGIELH